MTRRKNVSNQHFDTTNPLRRRILSKVTDIAGDEVVRHQRTELWRSFGFLQTTPTEISVATIGQRDRVQVMGQLPRVINARAPELRSGTNEDARQ